ncbi:MAG TPA: DUF5947 family protein [Terriglobales bacterium]|jgi:hypothetical protein
MPTSAITALQRLLPPAAVAPPPRPQADDRCELCAQPLAERHEHLLDLDSRRIGCACTGCALLFDNSWRGPQHGGAGPVRQNWRRLPRDRTYLPGLTLAGAEWASLGIPIQLAFISTISPTNTRPSAVTAAYPSPAGAVTAEIDPDVWAAIVNAHPELRSLTADLEALLIDRMSDPRGCYIIPLDDGYRLTGLIRQAWTGFTGGAEVKRRLAAFTQGIRAQRRPAEEVLRG